MKKVLVLLSLFLLVTYSSFVATKFADLKGDEWFGKNAIALADKGLITGFPDGTFRPTSNITVTQFISVAVRPLIQKWKLLKASGMSHILKKPLNSV